MSYLKSGRLLLTVILFFTLLFSAGQTDGQENQYNPITTAVPFLTIAPDSRHSGMGDVGVATSTDANSQHWNPSKYAFEKEKFGVSLSYTPWLSELVNDINLAYLSGFYKIDNNQVLGSSLRYFSMGDIQLNDQNGTFIANVSPNEFAFDVSYSRLLSEKWSGGVAFRYIHSDLSGGIGSETYVPGNAVAADISFSFINGWQIRKNQKSIAAGINISNLGTKISYDEGQNKEFLPANLKLGSTYFMQFEKRHSLAFSLDFNKLLVPTPTESTVDPNDPNGTIILSTDNSNQSTLSGVFGSFSDAPGGFEEELQEINISTGVEYWYSRQFAIRTGYFYENEYKGNRKFFSAGVGFKMKICALDVSYIVPTQSTSPLANTVRFSLLFDANSFAKKKEEAEPKK
jgi:hypothetical protein